MVRPAGLEPAPRSAESAIKWLLRPVSFFCLLSFHGYCYQLRYQGRQLKRKSCVRRYSKEKALLPHSADSLPQLIVHMRAIRANPFSTVQNTVNIMSFHSPHKNRLPTRPHLISSSAASGGVLGAVGAINPQLS